MHIRTPETLSFICIHGSDEDLLRAKMHIRTPKTVSFICMDSSGKNFSRAKMHINKLQMLHLYA